MLKSTNEEIQRENLKLKSEILKSNENVKGLHEKIIEHENHLNGIEQYLRVNNLEIVGLPPPEYEGAPIEDTLVNMFNSLPDLTSEISADDIDICHNFPSDRKDGKLVAVCKFVRRKTKFDVLTAKKKCRNFKFKDNDIFINEHLSPFNRHLFAKASVKKNELKWRYLWTRNGTLFMRENEVSTVFKIDNEENLRNLVASNSNNVHILNQSVSN